MNYSVSMPEINPLEIDHSFGDVTMGNRGGDLDAKVGYGAFKAGDVAGNTDLKISFGTAVSTIFKDGEIDVKYSGFDLESGQEVEFSQGYSDVEIGEVQELDLESKYGSVEIEKVDVIDADVRYSGFEIEELTGELELEASYVGGFKIERLAKTFTRVDIEGKYSSYTIGLEPGLNANIEAEFSYANLKVGSDVNVDFHYRVKESNKSYYKGIIGDGDDSKLISVDSGYGDLRLKED